MTNTQPKRLFCFGLGFSASAIARNRLAAGWAVGGTVRTAEKAEALRAEGIDAVVYGADAAPTGALLRQLMAATHVLQSVPTGETGDPVLKWARPWVVDAPLDWFGYLSTTVVYGDWGGDWVDETSEARSIGPRGLRRIEAEAHWTGSGIPNHIFRLAGIYGPGRNALVSLKRGRSQMVDKPGQVFSRTYVEDIKRVVVASMEQPKASRLEPAIYNVCDDEPCPPQEVIVHAAKLLGIAPPPLVPYDEASKTMSEMAKSFYSDNKRVRNDKIKRELGVTLTFPTYREGLADAFIQL